SRPNGADRRSRPGEADPCRAPPPRRRGAGRGPGPLRRLRSAGARRSAASLAGRIRPPPLVPGSAPVGPAGPGRPARGLQPPPPLSSGDRPRPAPPDRAGRREAWSRDGRLRLALDPAQPGAFAEVETAAGRLTLPAFLLTVEETAARRLARGGAA